ncbi:MAG: HlyC/CorC family transporter [Lachnospiraceae bacterium]|jgi:CBS domain containing-hemolysin-like protein|nr:HlyC/CorC family transporter [Lachnospiraceae bacterium]MBR3277325.1 HlyC/CorC family transporter [Lachnospiraceae bacterium]
MTIYFVLAGIVICVYLSSFFSGSEMSYSSCSRMRLESEMEEGSKKARIALYIVDHFDDALGAILIGNNLVNIACSSLGSVAVILITGTDRYAWVATVILTIAVIIFGETIPKITAKKGANNYAKKYAFIIRFLMIVLKPLVLIFVGLIALITAPMKGELIEDDSDGKVEELQTIIETAEDEDVIDEEESELVQAAIEFPDVSASEAMTARVDVLAIDIEDTWDEIIATIAKSHYTRIPVYEGSIDHIIGVLHMNKFLKAIVDSEEVDIRALLMEPCYVYKTMKLPEVLAAFRKHRQHLAVVVDEYGGTLGIISMEDVLEQVVGDIWDETDTVEDEVTKKSESEYEIDGDMPISDFLDLMDIREENFDFESETVGGWTIESFGRFPEAGESFRYADFTVTVLAMNELRVERVLVKIDR